MEDKTIKIYSYSKVWKVEKKIYSIGNLSIGVGIEIADILYTVLAIVAILILGNLFPVINNIKWIYRFIVIPYGSMWILRRKKLDGKNPIKYFFGILQYIFFTKRNYIERFQCKKDKEEKIKIKWISSQGYH